MKRFVEWLNENYIISVNSDYYSVSEIHEGEVEKLTLFKIDELIEIFLETEK